MDEIRKAGYPEGAEGEAKVNEILDKISTEEEAFYDKMTEEFKTLRKNNQKYLEDEDEDEDDLELW